MRFILSVLLATALVGTMATADVHQGQQTSFRLERRHDQHHHNKLDHSHCLHSSKKQRRDLQETMIVPNMQGQNDKAEGSIPALNLHSKKSHRGHNKKDYNRRKANHHKQSKRALELHRKKSHHSHKSSSHKHGKRDLEGLELHRKKSSHSHKKSSHKHGKRDLEGLELHRKKSSHSHKKSSHKHGKRDLEGLELHRKKSGHSHKKSSHKHGKRDLEGLELHRKKSGHSHKKSSHKHGKRDLGGLELHRKKSGHSHKKSSHKHGKRDLEGLKLHRKSGHSHKKSSVCGKHSKRELEGIELHRETKCQACQKQAASRKNHKRADVNEDTELAFHRKISRNRTQKVLGQGKGSKKNNKHSKRDLIKTQDIKQKSGHKQHKVGRKGVKARKN
ncbi:hypothetical protein B0O80DRAFT_421243 [Mortierella sp. GBAus27b]|nr:hypothetical protein B0O80DRAFT_421243 [Mortierella sp. GBAus27b]